jgi:hypothetical protein
VVAKHYLKHASGAMATGPPREMAENIWRLAQGGNYDS